MMLERLGVRGDGPETMERRKILEMFTVVVGAK